jgi:hypothetical protein
MAINSLTSNLTPLENSNIIITPNIKAINLSENKVYLNLIYSVYVSQTVIDEMKRIIS